MDRQRPNARGTSSFPAKDDIADSKPRSHEQGSDSRDGPGTGRHCAGVAL